MGEKVEVSINPLKFYNQLKSEGIKFFTGVPDSLLKELCLCIDENVPNNQHIIAANEGNAIALAAGYHLGTEGVPVVYMQNSGLGNAINPLLSLCDSEVYSIPVLLIIGWRGEPGVKDEPQHIKQGKIQLSLLECMNIDYSIIDENTIDTKEIVSNAVKISKNNNEPFALIVKKNTFSKYSKIKENSDENNSLMSREEALEILLENLSDNFIIVSTTGKTSREIFEIREKNNNSHSMDFLTVGSMGHCSSIALGIALSNPSKKIVCIDGDGALLMHLGILSTIGKIKPDNFYHILINNQVHDSVGGQETAVQYIDIQGIIESHGYNKILSEKNKIKLDTAIKDLINVNGPNFLEINVRPGARGNLGRPNIKPIDNKVNFMKFIKK